MAREEEESTAKEEDQGAKCAKQTGEGATYEK